MPTKEEINASMYEISDMDEWKASLSKILSDMKELQIRKKAQVSLAKMLIPLNEMASGVRDIKGLSDEMRETVERIHELLENGREYKSIKAKDGEPKSCKKCCFNACLKPAYLWEEKGDDDYWKIDKD